jgi:PAS domain S-box-containing protein
MARLPSNLPILNVPPFSWSTRPPWTPPAAAFQARTTWDPPHGRNSPGSQSARALEAGVSAQCAPFDVAGSRTSPRTPFLRAAGTDLDYIADLEDPTPQSGEDMKSLDFEQYRTLVEHAPMLVWRTGLSPDRDYFNTTWLAFTGRAFHQELANGWLQGIHPDDRDRCLALCLDHFERRQQMELEYRLRRHDGVYRYVFDRGVPYADPDGSFAGFVGSCIDVDDHRNQDAVSGAVEFFEMSLDNLCVTAFDGYFKRLNPSWTGTLGWTHEELMSRPSIDFVHPDDRQSTLDARLRLKAGVPLHALVNRYQCKDGTYRWFDWRSVARADRGLVYGAARDVTEQKEAQRALRELTESLTTTLNSIADGVIAIDSDGAVAHMNPVAENLTGWLSSEATGKALNSVFNIVDAETRVTAPPSADLTLREGIAVGLAHQTVLIGRNGTELPIASSSAPMRNADGQVSGAVLVFRDMTTETKARDRQEQLQRQLILADRMASVGTLAAGVAHEINNPLAYVIANLDLLLEAFQDVGTAPSPEQLTNWARMVLETREGTERIRKIVLGLNTFARADEDRRTVIDLRPVLELAIDMAHIEIRHRARLVENLGATPLVEADEARLGQLFINLLVNAAQALPEGAPQSNEIGITTATDARGRAVIEVRDTGPGIPATVIERVFDPFFTTKPIGVGTGIGLSICHSIVTGLGGEITVSSQEGRGTIFRVVLPPAAVRQLPEAPVAAVSESPSTSRSAAVLIVDDELAVARVLGRMLKNYDVTVVTTAKEALELIISDRPFDVVLSDLMMPEMSGMELYDELVRRGSSGAERMVFMTGGAFTPAAKAFLDRVPNQRFDKPFDAETVRQLVQTMVSQ